MTDEIRVVDASAVIASVVDIAAGHARSSLESTHRHAPHLVDAEVGNVLRRMVLNRTLSQVAASRSRVMAERLVDRRHPHLGPLAERAWQLRANLSFYDALYVALAEALDCPLVTADQRLARAARDIVQLEVV